MNDYDISFEAATELYIKLLCAIIKGRGEVMEGIILKEWLVNKDNSDKVYNILNKRYFSDLVLLDRPRPTAEEIAQELQDIGETIIAQKVLEGYFYAEA